MHIFSGKYKNRAIRAPAGLKTRPTSGRLREALFNICQVYPEGYHFLDLFAGSGAMGLEAVSRGAGSVTFIDNSRESIRCIQQNVKSLGVEKQVQIIYGDVFEMMLKIPKKGYVYDIIYADPPYEQYYEENGSRISFTRGVLTILDNLVDKNSLIKLHGSVFLEDAVKAMPEIKVMGHFSLKSSRTLGRSSLNHYIYTL